MKGLAVMFILSFCFNMRKRGEGSQTESSSNKRGFIFLMIGRASPVAIINSPHRNTETLIN